MPKSTFFLEKLLKRLDRIDKETLQTYAVQLAEENELYQAIFNELEEGLLLLVPSGHLEFANRQAMAWCGIKQNITEPAFNAVEDPQFSRFLQNHVPDLNEKKVEDLHLLLPKDIHLRVFLIPLGKTEQKKVLVLLVNQTEQKDREIDADRLARIESLISLAAGVAHEIGNPLNSLSIHLQLLKKEIKDLPPSRRKAVENSLRIMNTEAARLDNIVKNFLKASRKSPLRFRLQDLNEIAEEAIQFIKPETDKNRVKIAFLPDPKLPLFLMDRERLFQVFINLIKNAVEAMPKGGLLTIRISHKESIVAVRIEDQGSGISDKDLPHIFDAYYTTKEGGSGLGLMTVFNTISEHGGRIDVASKIKKGTIFTFFLPMRQPKLQLPKYDITTKK